MLADLPAEGAWHGGYSEALPVRGDAGAVRGVSEEVSGAICSAQFPMSRKSGEKWGSPVFAVAGAYFAGRNSIFTSWMAGLKSKSAVTKTRPGPSAASSTPKAST